MRFAPILRLAGCAILAASWIGFLSPAVADSVVSSGDNGYGRILFTLDPAAHSEVAVAAGVLTVHFDRKVSLDPASIAQGLPAYVSSARLDNDGQTLRLALAQELKPHTSSAGNRLALDLIPSGFDGAPPGLQTAPERASVKTPAPVAVTVDAATYADRSRLVFEWPKAVSFRAGSAGASYTVRFAAPATFDFAPMDRVAPPWVKHAAIRSEGSATVAAFEIDPGSPKRVYRDGNKVVLDVYAPKGDGATAPGAAKSPITPAQKAAVETAANQVNGAAASSKSQQVPGKQLPSDTSTQPAQPAQPAIQPLPGIAAAIKGSSLFLKIPQGNVAAFVRGESAWLVAETQTPLDFVVIRPQLMAFATSYDASVSGGASILRLALKQPMEIAVHPAGSQIEVTIAPEAKGAAAPISILRNDRDNAHAALAAILPGAAHGYTVSDPDAGDSLIVVPSQAGYAVATLHDYPDFAVLPSASGIVLNPVADDLAVGVAPGRVSIGRPQGLSLTASDLHPAQLAAAGSMAGKGASFIDFYRWRGSCPVLRDCEQALRHQVAALDETESAPARLALARFYIANGLGAEALGTVRVIQSSDPALASDRSLQVIRAAADYMMGRYRDVRNDLAAAGADPHVALWRGLAEAALENWPAAREALGQARPALHLYPADWQARARIASANAAIASGDIPSAAASLNNLPANLPSQIAVQAQLARARLLSKQGQSAQADDLFHAVEASGDEQAAAHAVYDRVCNDVVSSRLSRADAIEALEGLRYRWRGGALELNTLRKLASLYFASNDWRNGLHMLQAAARLFPDEDLGRVAQDEMRATFESLFLKGKADSLPPIQALAIFYEFVDLTPIGPKGDDMIRRMADRLVAMDLLAPATKLLKYQVENRLDGAARAQVAARLAALDLIDGRPKDALEALRNSRLSGLPDDLNRRRTLLEANALAALKQWQPALDVLALDPSSDAQKLRADISWRSANWPAAGNQAEQLISPAAAEPSTPLSGADHDNLLRAAIAYSLAGDEVSLARLRARFGEKARHAADAASFAVVLQPNASASASRDLAAQMASADSLKSFLDRFSQHRPN